MKKFFSMMMIAAAAISFAACGEDTPDGPVNPTPNGSKLETPAPEATEVAETSFTIAWEAVANADSYTVNLKGKNYTTAETSYKFENMNAGEYTVRVKATGEGYKDSDFGQVVVTLTGATSVDWFQSSVAPAEENPEKGYGPYNAVAFTWKGTGVKSLSYGLYVSEGLMGVGDDTIKDALTPIGAEDLAVVNSAEGLSAVIGPISGGTTYTMCLLVTNEAGIEFFSKEEVTTETAEASDAAKAWVGTWTVNSTKKYSIDQNGEGTVIDGAETFTVNITTSPNDPDEVIVDGWSVLGEGFTTYGSVDGDTLYILNGTYLGEGQDQNGQPFGYYWVGWYDFGLSIDGYPSNIATLDGETATSTNAMTFYDENNNEVPVVCFASDVFGVTETGGLLFFVESFPGVYRTGDMTWTKSAAAAQATSIDALNLNHKAIMSSVVLR
ncbi:MAG: fibronectin type III domain-containing protein [Alistipes sp.]|nr:fibronectin type III domain-containing protein [Alistipes sp.]